MIEILTNGLRYQSGLFRRKAIGPARRVLACVLLISLFPPIHPTQAQDRSRIAWSPRRDDVSEEPNTDDHGNQDFDSRTLPEIPRNTLPPKPTMRRQIPLKGTDSLDSIQIWGDQDSVSLVVRDTELGKVLAVVAQSQRLNIVYSDDINSKISISLMDVPLEQALTAMLTVAGYTWARQHQIIYVSRIDRASTLPAEIQGRHLQVFQLDYVSSADVSEAIQGMLSPGGKAHTHAVAPDDNHRTAEFIAVDDIPLVLSRVAAYLAQVDVPPRQVLIEAHILQVDLKDDARHGINFEHLFKVNGNGVKLETTGFANPTAGQAFFATIDDGNLKALLETLQTTTDAKTLASPRLLVLNGQSAKLQVGEQLGFRIVTVTETAAIESVEFLNVGVVLQVTPRISRDNRIVLRVMPKISSGAVNPETGLPEEETTEVETDLILQDGQGVVIGGLIQEFDQINQSKIPVIGDVRFIGKLFQRSEVEKSRREVIVALIPRLMRHDLSAQQRNDHDFMRSETPLFQGPLERVPRPWEPHLKDANPRLRGEVNYGKTIPIPKQRPQLLITERRDSDPTRYSHRRRLRLSR